MNRRLLAVLGVVVAALVVLGIIGTLAGRDDSEPRPGDLPAAQACSPVVDVPPAPGVPRHLNGELTYDRVPPSSGDHHPNPMTALRRVFTPEDGAPVERIVHNLEHGYVVVWYDPARADTELLDSVLDTIDERKVFAAPWPRGGMPAPYVVTAWGHEQHCTGVSGEAVRAFFAEHGGPNGEAPEPNAP